MSESKNSYVNKLLRRAQGIWENMGLVLEKKEILTGTSGIRITLRFNAITPSQAELLVNYMGTAFRRSNIYWKDQDGIKVIADVPVLG